MSQIRIAPIVLAGGRGSRLGIDKCLIILRGKSLLEHRVKSLLTLFDRVFILCKDNYPILRHMENQKVIVLRDMFKIRHPLSGIITAALILKIKYTHVLTCPVDLPYFTSEPVKYLCSLVTDYVDCVIPIWRNGHLEPLTAVYSVSVLVRLLRENPPSTWSSVPVRSILSYCRRIVYVSAERMVEMFGDVFLNINTPSHLRDAVARERI
ncbi:MAG: molybdenum cofactor guanylyltransferase [Crenarchaeota archaeon]|nr:molybdenum cofactor guanylyltransferase [Thermoproteota archaeon]